MALRDYIPEQAAVRHGARLFACTKPTVATVLLASSLLQREILATYKGTQALPLPDDPVGHLLPIFSGSRLTTVLATCVTLHGGQPGDLEEALQEDALTVSIIKAIMQICDLPRIIKSLDLEEASKEISLTEQPPDPEEVSGMEMMIILLAEKYHTTPLAVMQWPYEAFLSLMESAPKIKDKAKELADWSLPILKTSSLPGVGVRRADA